MPKKDNVYLGDGEQEDRTRFSLVKVGVDTGRLNRGFTKQTADSSNKNMDIPPISLAVGRYWRLRYDGDMGYEPSRPLVDRILRFWRLKWREVCEQRTDNSWNITDDEPTGHMVTINSLQGKLCSVGGLRLNCRTVMQTNTLAQRPCLSVCPSWALK